nr:unnamed protein product [Callosobruchus chinensis]
MPSSCCVPLCNSNYRETDRVTVFKFPKDVVKRKKWSRAIDRDDFTIKNSSVICIKHFEESFLIRNDTAVRPDGTILTVPRTRIKLSADAIPTIFQNQPEYVDVPLPPEIEDPAEATQETTQPKDTKTQKRIADFEDLEGNFRKK